MNSQREFNKENDTIDTIIKTIKKYNLIEDGDKIVLGVSGGPDSICMLDTFNRIRISQTCHLLPELLASLATFEIVVAHVNHLIREEAAEDEQYVREYCEKNKIEFYSKSIDVQKLANNNKIGTEEAGRIARYEFFDEILKKTNANKIAIAHNKNDKVETIIMHLLRGCGTNGLIGIEPKRGVYIRPLIECERKDIESYCEEQQLNPRIDRTNFENVYTRNKIRNVAIPYIQKEFNPNIIETIDRLSSLVSEEEEYMERQVKKAYDVILLSEKFDGKSETDPKNKKKKEEENNQNKEIILDLKKFNAQEKVIKSRVIRYTITKLFGSSKQIEQKHIEDIIKLCSNNIGNKYLTPNKNTKILIKNQKIYFSVNGKNP